MPKVEGAFDSLDLTPREATIMACAWASLKSGEPEVDMARFCALSGYTLGSGRNALGAVKTKLREALENRVNAAGAPVTPSKRTKNTAGTANDANAPVTPSTKGRGRAKRTPASKKRALASTGDDEEEGTPSKSARMTKLTLVDEDVTPKAKKVSPSRLAPVNPDDSDSTLFDNEEGAKYDESIDV